ncbi:MAG: DUF1592 domain-containing protein [Lentisphaeraceae bacterium]|nr:DUF1592 domain-containing protein [Lentisphaeraceae bacterium]
MIKKIIVSLAIATSVNAGIKDGVGKQFLEKHCYDCHDEDIQKGKLDLASLSFDPSDVLNSKKWEKVYKAVANGDMPPKKKKQPEEDFKLQFLSALEKPLYEADVKRQKEQGRTRVRRINRVEFERTLSDILGMQLDIKDLLPEDASKDGFDTVGEALNVSSVQIAAYMNALDLVLDKATTLYEQPKSNKYELKYQENIQLMQVYRRTGAFYIRPEGDGIVIFSPQKHAHLNSELGQYVIPFDGKYKVNFRAQSLRSEKPLTLNVRTGGRGHFETNDVPQTRLAYVNIPTDKLTPFEYEAEFVQGQAFRLYPEMLPHMRFTSEGRIMGIKKDMTGKQAEFKGPGIHIESVHVEGPIIEKWPPLSHELLWGGVKTIKKKGVKPNENINAHLDGEPKREAKPKLTKIKKKKVGSAPYVFDPKQKIKGEMCYPNAGKPSPFHATLVLAPDDPKAEAVRLMTRFAPVAFRRDVKPEEVQRHIDLVHYWLDEGVDFEESMKAGYKSLLTSSHFLYHKPAFTQQGEISDIALSERLSYFLWSSKPDEELLNLAKSGDIRDEKILSAQVERMLKDPRSECFLDNFLGQWLDLRKIDFTEPDSKIYPEFDPVLKWSMTEEVVAFFRELMEKDLSVENIIDSEFAMINERLARHYELPPVKGMEIRRVELPEDTPRGGVIGMSAIHKVTANGASTSPVVRGVWILERIMGIHPPPPPTSVDGIEADIRGTKTVLDQLEKHRESKACASCHQLIDPPGVALECFDVIGAWRTNYRNLNVEKASKRIKFFPNAPLPIVYETGLPVVASYELKDGRRFEDINQFKQMFLENPDDIAKNVVEKMITYATGSGISMSDHRDVKAVVGKIREKDYGFRSLIHEVVKSEIFQRK